MLFVSLKKHGNYENEHIFVEEDKKPYEKTIRIALLSIINLHLSVKLKTEFSERPGIYRLVTPSFDSNVKRF